MKTNIYHIIILIAALTGTLVLQSCNGKKTAGHQITVTIEPLRYFTQAIAGDKFDVLSMVPKGSNPESYDPTPQQLVNLENSIAYFRIGSIGFEQVWMKRLQQNVPLMKVFDTSKGIRKLYMRHSHEETETENSSEADPHIWNSSKNARIIAQNIFKGLCELEPKSKDYFEQNLMRLLKEIDSTEKELQTLINDKTTRSFLIFHPALSYFAKDYGLEQICIEEEGKEPSPTRLKDLIQICREKKIRIIFMQEEFDKRNAELIARETGTQLVTINPLSYNWSKEMIHIAKSLDNE